MKNVQNFTLELCTQSSPHVPAAILTRAFAQSKFSFLKQEMKDLEDIHPALI